MTYRRVARLLFCFARAALGIVGAGLGDGAEGLKHVDWQRKDRRRVLLGSNFGERLKVAKLQRDRALAHDLGGLGQALGRLEFAFGCDYLGATLALRLRLCRIRTR